MAQNKDRGFTGILLATGILLLLVFTENYPWYIYKLGESTISTKVYVFLNKIGFIKDPLIARAVIIATLFGANMAYRPIKKEGLDKKLVYRGFAISVLIFMATGLMATKSELGFFIRLSIMSLGYLGLALYTVKVFQMMDYTNKSKEDPFNENQETYQQTEEKIETRTSVNIPYLYTHESKERKGWINLVNLFRSLLLVGTPGSGKTFAVIEEIMRQLLQKRFAMVVYSFKQEDLVSKAYGYLQDAIKNPKEKYGDRLFPTFFRINFDDPRYSNRCNPISPYTMRVQSDAIDNSSTLMKNLNKEWIKQSDFFSKSAISFTGACIWYMKKKSEEYNKNICTLGHIGVLSTIKVAVLMEIMMQDSEVRNILVPFRDALEREAMDQLSGQTSTVQISLSSIASKEINYIMKGNEFDLKVNDRTNPKLVCLQNNPVRQEVYAAPLGLYLNNILKVVNKPNRTPMAVIVDELPTIFIMLIRVIIDTGRENAIATILGIQSVAQLILDYGKELSDVIYDNCANFICGAAKGETAKRLSELFGKIHQEKISKNTTSNDVSTNVSTQMMELLPKSKVAAMSTGTFAALVADTFENKIKEKKCYGELIPDLEAKKRRQQYKLPKIRSFKTADFDTKVQELRTLLCSKELVHLLKGLFKEPVDYIAFYADVLEKQVASIYVGRSRQENIVALVKRLRLYDYGEQLRPLVTNMPIDSKKVEAFIIFVIQETLECEQMDKVLTESFNGTIDDVDALVKLEYEKATGKVLGSAIFDEKKINGEIASAIDQTQIAVDDFMKEYNQGLKNEIQSGLMQMQEEAQEASDLQNHDGRNGYSSFPVENID